MRTCAKSGIVNFPRPEPQTLHNPVNCTSESVTTSCAKRPPALCAWGSQKDQKVLIWGHYGNTKICILEYRIQKCYIID